MYICKYFIIQYVDAIRIDIFAFLSGAINENTNFNQPEG